MPYKDRERRLEYGKGYRAKNPGVGTIEKREWRLDNSGREMTTMRERVHRNKLEWFKIIKELGCDKCSICGYNKCFAAIHYHHPNPKLKKYNPSDLFKALPTEKRIMEFKTFVPVCANCHAEIHWLK